jgi:hypothetical protein
MFGRASSAQLDITLAGGPVFVTPSDCPDEVPGQDALLEGYVRIRLDRPRKVKRFSVELRSSARLRSTHGQSLATHRSLSSSSLDRDVTLKICHCILEEELDEPLLAGFHVYVRDVHGSGAHPLQLSLYL